MRSSKAAIAASALLASATMTAHATSVPGAEWERLEAPERHGWSIDGLAKVCEAADDVGSEAVLVVQHGKIVWQCGDIANPLRVRSMRKSLLNAVVGQRVADGRLALADTLAALGIDDDTPLTDAEKQATVRDLLTSRSGIYLPAANETNADERPTRGSHAPGAKWFYNNWGFNALGTIVERAGGRSLFEQFEAGIARPLGMQDFSLKHAWYDRERSSRHPAYDFRMSARDLARFGLLYLNHGRWGEAAVLPAGWVEDSIAPHSNNAPDDEQDYGYLWWSQGPIASVGMTQRPFLARGWGYQWIWVFPEDQLILVHQTDYTLLAVRDLFGLLPSSKKAYEVLYGVLRARPRPAAAAPAE
jgi:CubicO group peptidase (beta-lactamase class C family)